MTPLEQYQSINRNDTGAISRATAQKRFMSAVAVGVGSIYIGWKTYKWPGVAGAIIFNHLVATPIIQTIIPDDAT